MSILKKKPTEKNKPDPQKKPKPKPRNKKKKTTAAADTVPVVENVQSQPEVEQKKEPVMVPAIQYDLLKGETPEEVVAELNEKQAGWKPCGSMFLDSDTWKLMIERE